MLKILMIIFAIIFIIVKLWTNYITNNLKANIKYNIHGSLPLGILIISEYILGAIIIIDIILKLVD